MFSGWRYSNDTYYFQSCPESGDFREEQCSAYNSVPYQDTYVRWSAHYDENEPCALTCRGSPVQEWKSRDEDAQDEALIVVQLANKVHDGTRCRLGSLDMCIDGKCQVGQMKSQGMKGLVQKLNVGQIAFQLTLQCL